MEYTKNFNEELFHIFGYVKDERIPNNNTPFLDYEGQASPKSTEKLNYYREMNKLAMRKRLAMTKGANLPEDERIHVGPGIDGGVKLVRYMEVLSMIGVTDIIEFAH